MDRKTLDDTSKFLSYVLRHQPEAIGLTLDGEGWADIDALIAGAARDGRALDRALLGAGRNLGLLGLDLLPPAKRWFARQAMGLGARPL